MKTTSKLLSLSLFLLGVFSPILLLGSYDTDPSRYDFEFVLLPDGTTTGYINSVIEDEDGLLWLSGDNGLLLYNGKDFQIFNNASEKNRLDIDVLVDLKVLNNEYFLLMGVDEIHWFNRNTRQIDKHISFPIHVLPGRVPTEQIGNLTVTEDQTIWLLSPVNNDSMYLAKIYKDGSIKYVDQLATKGFPKIISNNNQVIVGRNGGVNIYSSFSSEVKKIDIDSQDKIFVPYSMQYTNDGTLWIKGDCEFEDFTLSESGGERKIKSDCGAYFLKEGDHELIQFDRLNEKDLDGSYFMHKTDDKIWIGGDNLMLKSYDLNTEKLENYTSQLLSEFHNLSRSPFFTQILNYYEDRGGTIWISSTAGLIKVTPNEEIPITKYLRSDPDYCKSICVIHGVTEDEAGNLYVTYNNSIVKINPSNGELNHIITKPNNSDIATSYSLNYHEGNLYWNDLIYDLEDNTLRSAHKNTGRDEICNMIDLNGRLWVETIIDQNLSIMVKDLSSGTNKFLNVSKNFNRSYHINQFIQSELDGHIWVATLDGGIFEFSPEGKELRQFNTDESSKLKLNADYIACLYEDEECNLWLGSKKGISKINSKRDAIEHFQDSIKLYKSTVNNREVYSIQDINNDYLLLGTNKGLVRFQVESGTFETINGLTILHDEEFNRLASYVSKDSTYYLGSVNGLFAFKYKDIEQYFSNRSAYDLAISSVQVFSNFSNEIESRDFKSSKDTLVLKHDDGYLEIDYILPDHRLAEKVFYSHRIVGLADLWSKPTHETRLRYNYLPPGEYKLEIRAGYELSNLNYTATSLLIMVEHAWYELVWVQILLALFSFIIVSLALKHKIQQKLIRQQELVSLRTKISSDLHDDVGSTLSGLSMQAQVMAYLSKGEHQAQLHKISALSLKAMENMRDTVWAIDARQDKYVSLVDRMQDFAESNLSNANIDFEFRTSGIDHKAKVLPNVRQQLYLIYKEAICNILKHSDANKVVICFDKTSDGLYMSIQDNGKGNSCPTSSGLGLQNMEMRANQIGATLSCTNKNGFKIELNLNHKHNQWKHLKIVNT